MVTRSNVSRAGLGQLLEDRSNRVWLEMGPDWAVMAKERLKPGPVEVSGGETDLTGRVNVSYVFPCLFCRQNLEDFSRDHVRNCGPGFH